MIAPRVRSGRGRWVLLSLLAMTFGLQTSPGLAKRLRCEGVPIEFAGNPAGEFEMVCAAARQAAHMLNQCGFETSSQIRIEIVENPGSLCGTPAYGTYDPSSSTVRIASLPACLALIPGGSAYLRLAPRLAYQSFVVHEMTHAFVSNLTRASPLSRVAHEYIAYVVQIKSMTADDRLRFLSKPSSKQAIDIWHLNELSYFLNPEQFAALAFQHFEQQSDGCEFLQRIIRREVQFPDASFNP